MSKKRINDFLPFAYEGISKTKLYDNEKDKVIGNCKAQITSFGAAVNMGSLLSAIVFFSNNNKSKIERVELMKLIYYVIKKGNQDFEEIKSYDLFNYANDNNVKQEILDAAIAIKLAFNLYEENTSSDDNGGN